MAKYPSAILHAPVVESHHLSPTLKDNRQRAADAGFVDGQDAIQRYLIQKYKSTNTRKTYGNAIRQSLNISLRRGLSPDKIRYLEATPEELRAITPAHLTPVFEYLDQAGKSSQTIRLYHAALSKFFQTMVNLNVIDENPYNSDILPARPKAQKAASTITYLSRPQAEALVKAVQESKGFTSVRDYALILLLLNCALRRSEAADLRYSDIQERGGNLELKLRQTKSGVTQTVPLQSFVKDAIDLMRSHYGITGQVVFASLDRKTLKAQKEQGNDFNGWKSMSSTAIYKVLIRVSKLAGVKISPHVLRHTACTLAIQSGASILDVQKFARHSRPETTGIYTHVGNDAAKRAATLISVGI